MAQAVLTISVTQLISVQSNIMCLMPLFLLLNTPKIIDAHRHHFQNNNQHHIHNQHTLSTVTASTYDNPSVIHVALSSTATKVPHHIALFELLQAGGDASVALRNHDNTQFTGIIEIGSPPQRVNMLFDTGSHDTWLASDKCIAENNGHTKSCDGTFEATKSRSFRQSLQRSKFEQKYISASVSGRRVKDIVTMNKYSTSPISLGLVNHIKGDSAFKSQFNGLVGLGPSSEFLSSILNSIGSAHTFGVYLSSESSSTSSHLTFGGYDKSHIGGRIHWHAASSLSSAFWEIPRGRIELGNVKPIIEYPIVIDTGTSLIGVPAPIATAFYAEAGANDDGSIECYKVRDMPSLTIRLPGSREYILSPSEYAVRSSTFSCHVGITPTNIQKVILGDNFLRSYYSVFTSERPSGASGDAETWVGLAPVSPSRHHQSFPAATWINSWTFFVLAIMLSLLIAVIILILVIRRYRQQRTQDNITSNDQNSSNNSDHNDDDDDDDDGKDDDDDDDGEDGNAHHTDSSVSNNENTNVH